MPDYCFIVAGSEDRAYLLKRCITCLQANTNHKDAPVYLYWQGRADAIPCKEAFREIVTADTLQGIFLPRYTLFARYGAQHDYTILIDDDLFLYPDTSYLGAMNFLRSIHDAGICNLGRQFERRRNELRMIDYAREDYNVCGGIVFPRKCVDSIVQYFRDTPSDVTEDIFWIYLYIAGYDLYRDFSSNVIHTCHRPSGTGEASGYYRWRIERPHKPLLPAFVNARQVKDYFGDRMRWKVPECRDVNALGLDVRRRCRKAMGLED